MISGIWDHLHHSFLSFILLLFSFTFFLLRIGELVFGLRSRMGCRGFRYKSWRRAVVGL